MTAASSLIVGAITTTPYNFSASWVSDSNSVRSFRGASFDGILELALAYQLSELVANPALRSTIGGASGVLEYVTATSTAISIFTGYYLLQSFDMSPDGIDPDWPYTSFSLKGVFLGDMVQ